MALYIIDPSEKYEKESKESKDKFVRTMDNLSDLEEYIQTLSKESDNPSARKDLGDLLYDDLKFYVGKPSDLVKNDADEARSELMRKLGGWVEPSQDRKSLKQKKGYVEKNFDNIVDDLGSEELFKVVQRLPLYATKDEKINKRIKLIKEMQRISQIENQKDVESYVSEKIREMPEWMQISYYNYCSGYPEYNMSLFHSFARMTSIKLEREFKDNDGEINKKKIKDILKESLDVVKEEYDDEDNFKDKKDIFERAIRPYYLSLANELYPILKKQRKLDKDEDKEKRKVRRRKLGISA